MDIFYICQVDLSGKVGSAGSVRHVMEICENLLKLGNRVTLIAPGYGKYQEATPVNIVYIPIVKTRYLRMISYEILSFIYCLIYLILNKPNIIYWRSSQLVVFPIFLSKILKLSILNEVNGFTPDELETELLNDNVSMLRFKVIILIEKFCLKNSHGIITLTPLIKKRISNYYNINAKNIFVTPCGVNPDVIRPMNKYKARKILGLNPDCRYVGFVGYFFPWSGLEYLIESAPRIIEELEGVRFIIVGHGLWGKHLEKLVHQMNMSQYFIFTGLVPWIKLPLYLNAFDIGVAPYTAGVNEKTGGSSLKLMEYFCCKKAVVVSDVKAIPEIQMLKENNLGIAVTPEDPDALARAIVYLLKNDELRDNVEKKCRDIVVRERAWHKIAKIRAGYMEQIRG